MEPKLPPLSEESVIVSCLIHVIPTILLLSLMPDTRVLVAPGKSIELKVLPLHRWELQ